MPERKHRHRIQLLSVLITIALVASLVPYFTIPARAQASLTANVLSFDRIGIDANNPGGVDPSGNPIGPSQSNIQARIANVGTLPATNVIVSFQWTTANSYVNLSPYETRTRALNTLDPGETVDLFWMVEIARDKAAIGTTRNFTVSVTSDQVPASATQMLTVAGLISQSQSYSNIVNVPSTVNLGDTFIVEAEATMTRNIGHVTFPLQYDRSLFILEYARLDYYLTSDFSGNVSFSEDDIYYSDPSGSIPYKGIRAYYRLRAVRPGTGKFASLQMDANRNLTSFDYNSTIWTGSMQVVSSNPVVTMSKADSPDPVPAGNVITYTTTYGNSGNANCTNMVITDPVPENTTYVPGSAYGEPGVVIEYSDGSQWSTVEPPSVSAIRWIVGTLGAGVTGQQAGFQVTTDPSLAVGDLVENTSTLISDQTQLSDVAMTTIGAPPNPFVSKDDTPDPVEPGGIVAYTIVYGNSGGADAANVIITDYIPPYMTYLATSAFGEAGVTIEYLDGTTWSPVEPSTVSAIRWVVGTLANGVTTQYAGFQGLVSPSVPGGTPIENSATITSDQTPQTAVQVTTVTNQPPSAANDTYSVDEDTILTVAAPGVLSNDIDIDNGALSAILVTPTNNGSLNLNSDGSFTYTPNTNFYGNDTFAYKATDGVLASNIATVTITVNSINDPPVASDDAYTVDEDVVLNVGAPGILTNDSDVEGSPLTAVLASPPAHGNLSLNADGSFLYIPDANFFGADVFTYNANDGTDDSSVASVTITVNAINDPPATTDDAYSTPEDTSLSVPAPGVLSNDLDVEGSPLTAVLLSGTSSGSLTFNSNGSFTYTPFSNFYGLDSFSYQANDGELDSSPASVTITVVPVNDPPVAASDTYSTQEDTTLNVGAPGVLGNDSDTEGSPLTALLVSPPAYGSLTLNPDGSFQYVPDPDYSGTDGFMYKANDGTDDSNTVSVDIAVASVNDPPVAADDAYSTSEDSPLNVPAPGVLSNDTDVEGSPLTAVLVTGPTNGSLTLNSDGSFVYTPSANFYGMDTFTYKANDGALDSTSTTVTITVTSVNDPPVAVDDAYATQEDTALNIGAPGILGNDSDTEGSALTAALASPPAHGTLTLNADGSFQYVPDPNYFGADGFTYTANDGTDDSNTASVTITVTSINDAPVAADDAYSTFEDTTLDVPAPGVLSNDTDVEGSLLSATLIGGTTNGSLTLNSDGSFSYTPFGDFQGTDTFTYRANDGTTDSNTATVTITVAPVNDPPVASDDAYSTQEDTTLNVVSPGVLSNDSDAEESPLTALPVSPPAHGTLTLNSDGSFQYVPDPNYFGADSFTYKANDGTQDSNTASVTIAVNSVNDLPVAADDAYGTIEDTTLNVGTPGVLSNDFDVESPLTAVLISTTTNGSLSLNSDGSFTYTPSANFQGTDTFTYRANDGLIDSNLATVTITVAPVNDPPVALDDAYSTQEDITLNVGSPGVLSNDSDAEESPLTALLVGPPLHGTLTLNTDGSFQYVPDPNYFGNDGFTYKANDGTQDSNTASVTITVNSVNDPPVAADDAYGTTEDTPLNVPPPGVLSNDSDVEGSALTATLVNTTSSGSLTLNSDGSFFYTPTANFQGTDAFTYNANDGTSDSNTATVTITVGPVNDPPVAADDAATTAEDIPVTVDVLSNDFDVEGDTLHIDSVTQPANGSVGINPNETITYTPDPNFNGTDSFTYTIVDGQGGSDSAGVTISVTAVNDPPTANDDTAAAPENKSATIHVLANDYDIDSDPLTVQSVTDPPHGTAAINPDNTITYTPDTGFVGTDNFNYTISDGGLTASATVTVTVAPMAPPAVLTSPASNISTSTARLNGDLLDLGTAASVNVSFQWGLTSSYGYETAPQALSATGPFMADISGLAPGATYHFRARAVGDLPAYGQDLTFTTSTIPPTVATNPATEIAYYSAKLNGNLASLGTATTVEVSFEWASHDYYVAHGTYDHETSPRWPMVTTGAFSFDLGGLSSQTTYHFRAKAIGHETRYGADTTFTTLVLPPQPPNQPPTVSPIQGAACVKLPVTLETDPFSDPNPDDTHAASQWQVRTSTGTYSSPVFDTGTDTENLTSVTVSTNELTYGVLYYWRVRHQDSQGLWSEWSGESHFTTADTPDGTNVIINRNGASILFTAVYSSGCTWVTKSTVNPVGATPGRVRPLGEFVDIITTADHGGLITVGLGYSDATVQDEDYVRLYHWTGSEWQDITVSLDKLGNIVYGQVGSLSPFFAGYAQPWGEQWEGIAGYSHVFFAFADEVFSYLFDMTSGGLTWTASDGQIEVDGNLPPITQKGNDIIGSIMTIVHNGVVFLAELSTLFPASTH